ncbi:alpha-L-fucosidase [Maribacter polysiphoniae]|uniref:alpha-L-fucosidase n=1 Tax=Maribacter polysiphoniae TaxID=429344 RepID=A0A316E623_9FLAO|nr:alpha-L-fucosidase [Maribacter polysiphoniae]MBD1259410.1 alpha-L-fucosidase [Maribacter polysiphoniae]PWK24972.1 alpha-L-fucosidase [Maribacter polysiphoniae]
MVKFRILVLLLMVCVQACNEIESPEPIRPTPSERQLAWHGLEYYAFVHFNMNTFTNMEWGTGGESPQQFNPTELDTRQWAKVVKDAGMKGIILTAKHHDGFCLWPTKTTEHSVKNSPWKEGKGDVLKDLSEACKEYGLKFGVYLSPWDRNHAAYGQLEYIDVFHEQLRELLTNYGEVFEVWFDGANGGSGYYGGANETRKVDNKTYYAWDKTVAIVRELQPNAVIFSDGGPDVRWVGNEQGWAEETNWSIMRRDGMYPGWPRYMELRSGHEDGTHWLPAEADVSMRPGWYYHPAEDHQVKTLPQLLDIYYNSVGRNTSLLLNLPVDKRGLVHEREVEVLMDFRRRLDLEFGTELAQGIKVTATDERGDKAEYKAANVNDGDPETYWATNDGVTRASVILEFDAPTKVNRILLQEYIPLGQRVKNFIVSAEIDGKWHEIDGQTTIGNKRILRFKTVEADKIKVQIMDAKGPIALSNIALYRAPNLLTTPVIKRSREGMVSLTVPDEEVEIYYTLDGREPTTSSKKYKKPFRVSQPTLVKYFAYDAKTNARTEVSMKEYDIAKSNWNIVYTTTGNMFEADKAFDDDPITYWATDEGVSTIQEVIIDLGRIYDLKGFTYWPMQERYPFGIITNFEFYVSPDNRSWKRVVRGKFPNIVNHRVEQKVKFKPSRARYIKLRGIKVAGEDYQTSFAEVGVLTK